jgi:hypothetical protein
MGCLNSKNDSNAENKQGLLQESEADLQEEDKFQTVPAPGRSGYQSPAPVGDLVSSSHRDQQESGAVEQGEGQTEELLLDLSDCDEEEGQHHKEQQQEEGMIFFATDDSNEEHPQQHQHPSSGLDASCISSVACSDTSALTTEERTPPPHALNLSLHSVATATPTRSLAADLEEESCGEVSGAFSRECSQEGGGGGLWTPRESSSEEQEQEEQERGVLCADCGQRVPRSSFSGAQLKKKQGAGACKTCVSAR